MHGLYEVSNFVLHRSQPSKLWILFSQAEEGDLHYVRKPGSSQGKTQRNLKCNGYGHVFGGRYILGKNINVDEANHLITLRKGLLNFYRAFATIRMPPHKLVRLVFEVEAGDDCTTCTGLQEVFSPRVDSDVNS